MPREPQNVSEKKIRRAAKEAHEAKARPGRKQSPAAPKAAPRNKANAGAAHPRQTREPRPDAPPSSSSLSSSSARADAPVQSSVAVIGAGRLGSALALALSRSGYRVSALVARRARSARRAARALSPRPLALDATQLDLLPDTDLLLITTPDDQIAQVAALLAAAMAERRSPRPTRDRRRRPRVALHASGALSSGALAPLGEHDFSLGSLHPLVSVSDSAAAAAAGGARNLRGAFYCLEGEARALTAARKIVRALGGRSFSLAARDKSLYHAAAVIASGHTVALFSLAADLLARCGLDERRARRVLLPLLASTLDNLKRSSAPEEALTGTFARADLSTVRRHLAAFADAGDLPRDATRIYALLGERSLHMAARRNRFDPSVAAEISLLLRMATSASDDE